MVRLKCGMRPNVRENSSKGSLPVLDEAGSGFRLWGDVALLMAGTRSRECRLSLNRSAFMGGRIAKPLCSPLFFPRNRYCSLAGMVAPKVSVRKKDREESYEEVSEYIKELVKGKVGNYFIYTPSYEYLESLIPYLDTGEYDLNIQSRDMTEDEKESFLSCFVDKPKRTTLGLAVIGGAFSEGIDLVGERIIGVCVIGVGYPQICYERDLIRNYFNKIAVLGNVFYFFHIKELKRWAEQ